MIARDTEHQITDAPSIAYNTCYTPAPTSIKHPATYTDSFIPKFAEILSGCASVLDPFGGVGKLALIKQYGFKGKVICNELEREWAEIGKYDVDEWSIGDAANLRIANLTQYAQVRPMGIEWQTTITQKMQVNELPIGIV